MVPALPGLCPVCSRWRPIYASTSRAARVSNRIKWPAMIDSRSRYTLTNSGHLDHALQGLRIILSIHTCIETMCNDMVFRAYAREVVNKHRMFKMDYALYEVGYLCSLYTFWSPTGFQTRCVSTSDFAGILCGDKGLHREDARQDVERRADERLGRYGQAVL